MRTARIFLQVLASLAAGLIPGLLEWVLGFSPNDVFTDCVIGLAYSAAISAIAWSVLPRAIPIILKLPRFFRWVTLIVVITAIAALGGFIAVYAVTALHVIPASAFWHAYSVGVRISVVITLIFALSATVHSILTSRLNHITAQLKEQQLAEERLRQAAMEARLSSLESRIHPHFLFNTLNSISALIRENPTEAERMVERLAALLRFSLDSSGARLVPLSQELSIVRSYLEIEKVRFGTRLSYRIDADPALNSLEVPPLSIQTLVENSVKFAVSPRREGAEITIRVQLRNGKPAIDVLDNGPGFSLADVKAGHGLDLLQSRLAAQFGPSSALEIGHEPQLTRVSVIL
jgi:LytS/YehU family sensor histidine kinase